VECLDSLEEVFAESAVEGGRDDLLEDFVGDFSRAGEEGSEEYGGGCSDESCSRSRSSKVADFLEEEGGGVEEEGEGEEVGFLPVPKKFFI
jgi:hypothetical protein